MSHHTTPSLFSYEGRYRRSEFWPCFIIIHLILIPLAFLLYTDSLGNSLLANFFVVLIILLIEIFILPPIAIKRLHDLGLSGLFYWAVLFIFTVCAIFAETTCDTETANILHMGIIGLSIGFFIILCCNSEKGTNQFGTSSKYPEEQYGYVERLRLQPQESSACGQAPHTQSELNETNNTGLEGSACSQAPHTQSELDETKDAWLEELRYGKVVHSQIIHTHMSHHTTPSLFSYEGRYRRSEFWPCFIIIHLILIPLAFLLYTDSLGNSLLANFFVALIILLIEIFILAPIAIKRLHDLGLSGLCYWAVLFIFNVCAIFAETTCDIETADFIMIGIKFGQFGIWGFLLMQDSEKGTNEFGTSSKYPEEQYGYVKRLRIQPQESSACGQAPHTQSELNETNNTGLEGSTCGQAPHTQSELNETNNTVLEGSACSQAPHTQSELDETKDAWLEELRYGKVVHSQIIHTHMSHHTTPSLFSYEGRYRRSEFWPCFIIINLISIPLDFLLYTDSLGNSLLAIFFVVLIILLIEIFILAPIAIKRLHDIGVSGLGYWGVLFIFTVCAIFAETTCDIETADFIMIGIKGGQLGFWVFLLMQDSEKGTNEFGPSSKYPEEQYGYVERLRIQPQESDDCDY